jgi:hypothetical protein
MPRSLFRRRVLDPEWLLQDALWAHYYNDHKQAWRLLTQVAEMVSNDKLDEPTEEKDYYVAEDHPDS